MSGEFLAEARGRRGYRRPPHLRFSQTRFTVPGCVAPPPPPSQALALSASWRRAPLWCCQERQDPRAGGKRWAFRWRTRWAFRLRARWRTSRWTNSPFGFGVGRFNSVGQKRGRDAGTSRRQGRGQGEPMGSRLLDGVDRHGQCSSRERNPSLPGVQRADFGSPRGSARTIGSNDRAGRDTKKRCKEEIRNRKSDGTCSHRHVCTEMLKREGAGPTWGVPRKPNSVSTPEAAEARRVNSVRRHYD